MKRLLFTLLLVVGSIPVKAQSKFSYALSVNANTTFLNGTRGVEDPLGFSGKTLNLGFGIGGLMHWKMATQFDLAAGLQFDYSGIGYKYYNTFKKYRAGYFHIPISVKFNIPSKTKNNFYIELGTNILLSLSNATSYSKNLESSKYIPEFESHSRTRAGITPQLLVGIGWRCTTFKGRVLAYSFIFNNGFVPVTQVEVMNKTENIRSVFNSNNTQLKFQFNWFFKDKVKAQS